MIKFIFTTDWHICFKQPGCRLDNVLETQLCKLEKFVDVCNSELPDFIIHGGDLFDSPRCIDPTILNKVINILKKLKAPMYYIPGSHDIYGYNLESCNQAFIGTLASANCINIIKEKGIYQFPGKLFIGVLPCQLTNDLKDYIIYKDCDIIVSHNMITETSVPYSHILIDDLAKEFTKKIFLCGHNHKPFYVTNNNNLFVNTGPLIRTSIVEKDIVPHVSVFIKNDTEIQYYEKQIECASNVFNEKTNAEEQKEVQLTFNEALKNTDLVFSNVYEVLHHIVTELKIDPKYEDLLKVRLENAEALTNK